MGGRLARTCRPIGERETSDSRIIILEPEASKNRRGEVCCRGGPPTPTLPHKGGGSKTPIRDGLWSWSCPRVVYKRQGWGTSRPRTSPRRSSRRGRLPIRERSLALGPPTWLLRSLPPPRRGEDKTGAAGKSFSGSYLKVVGPKFLIRYRLLAHDVLGGLTHCSLYTSR